MIRSQGFFALLSALALLTGCNPYIRPNPQVASTPDKVSLMLAESAQKASASLETLAAVEQARSPGVAVAPIENAPPELRRAITVNWVGPVEPITRTLADRAGYTFEAFGTPPPVPMVVSIDAENRPVIEVLRSIGLQLGQRADVRIDGSRRAVEVHYAPNTGAGG